MCNKVRTFRIFSLYQGITMAMASGEEHIKAEERIKK